MRTQLFRTPAVLVDGASVVVALKSIDGVSPVNLFLENMDQAASLRTKFGSKNANVRFVAVDRGTVGNLISVEITAAPNQAFSADVTAYGIVVNLRCDGDGRPNQTASDVIDLLNADPDVAALVRVSLALGSDGSAVMELVSPTHAMEATDLAGGSAAVQTGAAVVDHSHNADGPWVAHAAAGSALSTVAANEAKSYTLSDTVVSFLRVRVSQGGGPTRVVLSAQATHKGL